MTREEAKSILLNAAWLGTNEGREKIESAVEFLCGEPCDDAISRQAVLDILKSSKLNWIVFKRVNDLPSVNLQEITGYWVAQDIHNCHTDFKCSECDYIHNFMHLYGEPTADYTYCPNCGARMLRGDKA